MCTFLANEIADAMAVSVSTLFTLQGTFSAEGEATTSEHALLQTLFTQMAGMELTYLEWKAYSIALPWFSVNLFGQAGDGSDSKNYFMYSTNSSWQVKSSPKDWNGTRTGSNSIDMGGFASLRSYWLTPQGERIKPPFNSYDFASSLRPWYQYSIGGVNRTGYVPRPSGTYTPQFAALGAPITPTLVASVHLSRKDGTLVGVAASGLSIPFIEETSKYFLTDLEDPGTESWLYTLTASGKIMMSNYVGLAYTCQLEVFAGVEQPTCDSVDAADIAHPLMAGSAAAVQARDPFPSRSNNYAGEDQLKFRFGDFMVDTKLMVQMGGLPLRDEWVIVVLQPIDCNAGYELSDTTLSCVACPPPYTGLGGPDPCRLCLEGYFLDGADECVACPVGAKCAGGDALPYPTKGYWADISSRATAGDVYECRWDTCPGSESRGRDILRREESDDAATEESNDAIDAAVATLLGTCFSVHNYNASSSSSSAMDDDDDNDDGTVLILPDECEAAMCADGSHGALCQVCEKGWAFSAAYQRCTHCAHPARVSAGVLLVFLVLLLALVYFASVADANGTGGTGGGVVAAVAAAVQSLRNHLSQSWLAAPFKFIDSGTIKILWSSSQILGTVAWNFVSCYADIQPLNKDEP